jgi:predicted amidohydrolase
MAGQDTYNLRLMPRSRFLAAAVQMTSTSDAEANWRSARELVGRAAAHGAELVATPENTNYLGPHQEKVRLAESLAGPTCNRFAQLARQHGLHLLLGSFNERSPDPARCYNTSVLFGPDGEQLAVYRKIHLFDIDLSAEVRFKESETVMPGAELVVARTALAAVGLSICYDLRFPELYARLAAGGAELLTVPAAFTLRTGKDHWHPLLRARAIETQCWVIAPAQSGRHDDGGLRESYGHAMIVDPWGQVTAMAPDGTGLALAEIDLERLAEVRRAMPVSEHRRL